MTLPPRAFQGQRLSAAYLNQLIDFVRRNETISGQGINVNRTNSGTYLSSGVNTQVSVFNGERVTVSNTMSRDIPAYSIVGISEVSNNDDLTLTITDGVRYQVEAATPEQLRRGQIALVDETIEADNAGSAWLNASAVITRVRFEADKEEPDFDDSAYRFATIDTSFEDQEDNRYILRPTARGGPFIIVDVEPKKEKGQSWRWAVVAFAQPQQGAALYAPAVPATAGQVFQVGEVVRVVGRTRNDIPEIQLKAGDSGTDYEVTVEAPTSDSDRPIAVVVEPIEVVDDRQRGLVALTGVALAQIDEDDDFADQDLFDKFGVLGIRSGSKKLFKQFGMGVADLLYENDSSLWALVQFPPRNTGAVIAMSTAEESGGEVMVKFIDTDETVRGPEHTVKVLTVPPCE